MYLNEVGYNSIYLSYYLGLIFVFRTKTLEEDLVKCRSEIASLEKELSEALHNNLLEYSNRTAGNFIWKN